jgi:hypothetical protein
MIDIKVTAVPVQNSIGRFATQFDEGTESLLNDNELSKLIDKYLKDFKNGRLKDVIILYSLKEHKVLNSVKRGDIVYAAYLINNDKVKETIYEIISAGISVEKPNCVIQINLGNTIKFNKEINGLNDEDITKIMQNLLETEDTTELENFAKKNGLEIMDTLTVYLECEGHFEIAAWELIQGRDVSIVSPKPILNKTFNLNKGFDKFIEDFSDMHGLIQVNKFMNPVPNHIFLDYNIKLYESTQSKKI